MFERAAIGKISGDPRGAKGVIADRCVNAGLIEAVALPWFDIIAFLKTDPSIAFQLPWETWEEIIAGAYKKLDLKK